ncbi:MAG: Maf family protein [Acholeplasmatales bacterium]|jgi:septum formation protein|nr:Maf family protein [Acholeplasmatales bacterium]
MIILASSSPRRKQIMEELGYPFTIIPSNNDEIVDFNQEPSEVVKIISYNKAMDVFKNHEDCIVIGSDTVCYKDRRILGKPKDFNDACEMLRFMNNGTHYVYTGVSILKKGFVSTFYTVSAVTFKNLSEYDIINYVKTNEPFGKAGSYAIQGLGRNFISSYEGSFYTIMGLPKEELEIELKKALDFTN